MAQPINEIISQRKQKLAKIKKLGVNPYPAIVTREQTVAQALIMMAKKVAVAGRVMAWRGHGKMQFADIFDETGKIQLVFKFDLLSQDNFKFLKQFNIGDFIAAQGEVFKTKAGEISILVKDYQLLTKSIRPLPDQWYGLKDVEERYRQRYLDMILNPEVVRRLKVRSRVITHMREFLDSRGYLEVETPTLQPVYGGGFAKPFVTHHHALGSDFYLRISDEMYLKRLIVGGFDKVYEITKVFRNEGIDFDHNPEFTMFEAQIAYEDYRYGMDIIEEITEYVVQKSIGKTKVKYRDYELDFKRPWKRYRMVEAIKEFTGFDPLLWKSLDQAKQEVQKLNLADEKIADLDRMHSIGEVIAFAFEEGVEEKLIQPTIIYDFPIEVSPLAKKCADPRFTQRFEQFAAGSELGNNYTELNDPVDLRKRFVEEKKREKAGFDEAHQTDYDYLAAIEHGFPPTCGIAIGIDRLIMMITDAANLKEVIAFPTLKAIGPKAIKKAEPKKYSYQDRKITAILNKELPKGLASNALGHLAFAAGHWADNSWMGREKYTDASGQPHIGISRYPLIVFAADKRKIKEIVKIAKTNKDVTVVDYPQEMFDTDHDDKLNKAISKATKENIKYHAVLLVGPSKIVDSLTKGLSLYK